MINSILNPAPKKHFHQTKEKKIATIPQVHRASYLTGSIIARYTQLNEFENSLSLDVNCLTINYVWFFVLIFFKDGLPRPMVQTLSEQALETLAFS
ncbi:MULTISPECIES: hypothetical protein [Cyanophyceae]|uniref:Transposase n=1 Tax=Leptolyngbya subtilissima DQ-A4 TaxID=2933933 RepID=A0ABV0KBE1_9CYAN|nr:hypothetical protein [Nodosilinea sp. FACHB-141]MBD2115066.1 hypothetical protein [Nodosilinea sp. FACHB-141]